MWYFSWVLGITAAMSIGVINALWYEAHQTFERRDD